MEYKNISLRRFLDEEITDHQLDCAEAMRLWTNEVEVKKRIAMWTRYVDIRDGLPPGTTAKLANKNRVYYCKLDDTFGLN